MNGTSADDTYFDLGFSYEPGTTGGVKTHSSSSGSGPSDSVEWNVPAGMKTATPGS